MRVNVLAGSLNVEAKLAADIWAGAGQAPLDFRFDFL
jgi:hypothetical protein